MTPQEDNEAPEQLSTKVRWRQVADTVWGLLACLGFSIGIAYFLVYGEPKFDRIHEKYGVYPGDSEVVLWCVALVFYLLAISAAWILKSQIKPHSLGHKCALLVAVLLTAPIALVVLLIGVPFLWERLNSMPMEVWLIIGFLMWQKVVEDANYKRFVKIVSTLMEIQQSVRNIEKNKTEPKAKWGE